MAQIIANTVAGILANILREGVARQQRAS